MITLYWPTVIRADQVPMQDGMYVASVQYRRGGRTRIEYMRIVH